MRRASLHGLLVAALAVLGAAGAEAATPRVPLVEAAKTGDLEAVRALLEQHVDVNAPEVDGTTALHWAVVKGGAEVVNLLVNAGASVMAANRYGVVPLSLAAQTGSAAIVERLLEAGADAKAPGPGGETPLMTAARTGQPGPILALLSYGADPNAFEPGKHQTALMWAAAANNVSAIQTLVAGGADLHARSEEHNDRTVLNGGRANDWLGKAGEIAYQFTPLLFAVLNGHLEAVQALLALGAEPNETTLPDRTSALVLACINAHWELATLLLDAGADPTAAEQGWTALHQVARTRTPPNGRVPPPVQTGRIGSLAFAETLIERGARVDARATKELVDIYRRNVSWIDATPFFIAAKGADLEMMQLLASRGADTTLGNEAGDTPLTVASGVSLWDIGGEAVTKEKSVEAVRFCLEVGCGDVNAANDRGETALHGAAFLGASAVVQMLADHGARLNVKERRGYTPYMLAVGRDGEGNVVTRLRQDETAEVIAKLLTAQGLPVDDLPPPRYSFPLGDVEVIGRKK